MIAQVSKNDNTEKKLRLKYRKTVCLQTVLTQTEKCINRGGAGGREPRQFPSVSSFLLIFSLIDAKNALIRALSLAAVSVSVSLWTK